MQFVRRRVKPARNLNSFPVIYHSTFNQPLGRGPDSFEIENAKLGLIDPVRADSRSPANETWRKKMEKAATLAFPTQVEPVRVFPGMKSWLRPGSSGMKN